MALSQAWCATKWAAAGFDLPQAIELDALCIDPELAAAPLDLEDEEQLRIVLAWAVGYVERDPLQIAAVARVGPRTLILNDVDETTGSWEVVLDLSFLGPEARFGSAVPEILAWSNWVLTGDAVAAARATPSRRVIGPVPLR